MGACRDCVRIVLWLFAYLLFGAVVPWWMHVDGGVAVGGVTHMTTLTGAHYAFPGGWLSTKQRVRLQTTFIVQALELIIIAVG